MCDARHEDERVPAHQAPDAALVLGLELVVELLGDPLAHLGASAFASSPGASRLTSGSSSVALRRSVSTASATPGYWIFTATSSPSTRGGAVNLADRGRGERLLVEVAEHPAQRAAELLAHHLLEVGEAHRRDVVAERGEAALQLVPLVLREAVELDHRDHLADLHRRAAHLPELVDELLHQRGRPLAFRRRRALGRPDPVGGAHPRPAQALAGHQAADAGRPREPAGRQLSRLGRIVGASTHPPSLAASIPRDGGLARRRRHPPGATHARPRRGCAA